MFKNKTHIEFTDNLNLQTGYVGSDCTSLCTAVSPCSQNGQCILNTSSQYGYTCKCESELYYGRTCQHQHLQPCPKGWRGTPVCMPCNCPVERNFDIDCEGNGGKCVCKVTKSNKLTAM